MGDFIAAVFVAGVLLLAAFILFRTLAPDVPQSEVKNTRRAGQRYLRIASQYTRLLEAMITWNTDAGGSIKTEHLDKAQELIREFHKLTEEGGINVLR